MSEPNQAKPAAKKPTLTLSTTGASALTTAAITALATASVAALSTAEVNTMTTSDIAALTASATSAATDSPAGETPQQELVLDVEAFLAEGAPKQPEPDPQPEIQFVKMVRDPDSFPAPHTAIVHPDEVENYRPGGWTEAE